MGHDRITAIHIEGMRSIDKLELRLEPMTVLIGANGSGKSTIVEACELLKKAAIETRFVEKLYEPHGGPQALMRLGAPNLRVSAVIEGPAGQLIYQITLVSTFPGFGVLTESLATSREPRLGRDLVFNRMGSGYTVFDPTTGSVIGDENRPINPDETVLATWRGHELRRARDVLGSIEVHVPFETRPRWSLAGQDSTARSSNIVRPVQRLELGAKNLANAYYALRNQRDWATTLERVQLALGDDVEDVVTIPDPGGGVIGLALRIRGLGEVPSFALSDGQLGLLALIAIMRMKGKHPGSLVVLDEPDLHLHPTLVRRLTADLEELSDTTPLVVATHSDAMLDVLSAPEDSVVLCELDERRATVCRRPDKAALDRWLETYRGLGALRSEGYEGLVFPPADA